MSTAPEKPARRRGRPPSGGREAIFDAALQLLRERGIARLTTREIADVAGVSEGSVFYHYGDRAGLLEAVFESVVRPLKGVSVDPSVTALAPREFLARFGGEIERFLDRALPVIAAAQADAELREAFAAYLADGDLGVHRGVAAVSEYLRARQRDGTVRADVVAEGVAVMFIGSCFVRAAQRQLPVGNVELPPLETVIDTFEALLRA